LSTAEHQQLAREVGGAFASIADFPDVIVQLTGRKLRAHHLAVAQHHGQDIVEVVRNSAGKAPHRFHLLRLAQLIFQAQSFTCVP